MKWFLNLVYIALLSLLSPVILWRLLRHGRYRRGWNEKLFGHLPEFDGLQPVVWFHAVSVGEVLQLQKVIELFRQQTSQSTQILITSSTDTGFELAASRFPECTVSWFPLDFSWAVTAALKRVRPDLVVLVELELWPNFLKACSVASVRTALINARMSDRSYSGYSRIRALVSPLFQDFAVVAAQTQQYADRLICLGTRVDVTVVTGSIKFDGVSVDRDNPGTLRLRELFCIDRHDVVFIAGSTQHPEEQLAVDLWKQLRPQHTNLRLILVPRHRERFNEVASLVTASDCELVRRSSLPNSTAISRDAVILLDTIGELGACWGLSDVAFVGGSFGARGGQNMLEPAAFGAAVLFGPNTSNFREIVAQLLHADGAIQVQSEPQLQREVLQLLDDPVRRQQLGNSARSVVLAQQGALARTVELLGSSLQDDTCESSSVGERFAA